MRAPTPRKLKLDSLPAFISIREAQDLSGLGRTTINRWMWSGKVRSAKAGSRRLIESESFVQVLGLNQQSA